MHTRIKFVIPRERSDRGNLPEGERKLRRLTGGEPPRGAEPARASVWGSSCTLVLVSSEGDFSTNARNDNVLVWFYNVISTGVRTIVRTQWRNPPQEKTNIPLRYYRVRSREISRLRSRCQRCTRGWPARVRGRHFVSTRLPRFARNDNRVRFTA